MWTREMKLERTHDDALVQHDRRWHEMHRIGIEQGHDSEAYREAREAMLVAARVVREAARAKRRRP